MIAKVACFTHSAAIEMRVGRMGMPEVAAALMPTTVSRLPHDAAGEYLQSYVTLCEVGFKEERITEALLLHDNDREQVCALHLTIYSRHTWIFART
jgi:hypothetical protein